MQKFISKLSDNERKVFYIAVLFGLLALIDRLFIGPFLSKIDSLQQQIASEKEAVQLDLKFLTHKERIEEQNRLFSKYYLQEEKDSDVINAEFLREIEKLAQEQEVTISRSVLDEPQILQFHKEYYLNLDCSGPLKNVVSFLHKINSSDSLMKVTRCSMTPKRGTENEVTVGIKILRAVTSETMENEIPS